MLTRRRCQNRVFFSNYYFFKSQFQQKHDRKKLSWTSGSKRQGKGTIFGRSITTAEWRNTEIRPSQTLARLSPSVSYSSNPPPSPTGPPSHPRFSTAVYRRNVRVCADLILSLALYSLPPSLPFSRWVLLLSMLSSSPLSPLYEPASSTFRSYSLFYIPFSFSF